jgi:hypothetical protein
MEGIGMTPSEHFDNLAIACIKKASELEALADIDNQARKQREVQGDGC